MVMPIFSQPNFQQTVQLLSDCQLPINDLSETMMCTFLGCGDVNHLDGLIGLEIHGHYGLLRSLAIAPCARNQGFGKALVSALETLATSKGLTQLYLLTETAKPYFTKLGYIEIDRQSAPKPIQQTSEFSSICPDHASIMYKCLK